MPTRRFLLAAVVAATTGFACCGFAQENSALFGYLLPLFKAKTGFDVKVMAQGTGQALDTARRGDADVVFVHARAAEEKFMAEGFGGEAIPRRDGRLHDLRAAPGYRSVTRAISSSRLKATDGCSTDLGA